MKNLIARILTGLIGSFVFFTACHKIETYPTTPQIEYLKFFIEDTSISFSFVDGDGNIGFKQNEAGIVTPKGDTLKSNLFTVVYEKIDSVYEEIIFEEAMNFRIPNVEPQGVNKTLKGEINFKLDLKHTEIDTFRLDFYIIDNALNKSNIETTPALTFN